MERNQVKIKQYLKLSKRNMMKTQQTWFLWCGHGKLGCKEVIITK